MSHLTFPHVDEDPATHDPIDEEHRVYNYYTVGENNSAIINSWKWFSYSDAFIDRLWQLQPDKFPVVRGPGYSYASTRAFIPLGSYEFINNSSVYHPTPFPKEIFQIIDALEAIPGVGKDSFNAGVLEYFPNPTVGFAPRGKRTYNYEAGKPYAILCFGDQKFYRRLMINGLVGVGSMDRHLVTLPLGGGTLALFLGDAYKMYTEAMGPDKDPSFAEVRMIMLSLFCYKRVNRLDDEIKEQRIINRSIFDPEFKIVPIHTPKNLIEKQ